MNNNNNNQMRKPFTVYTKFNDDGFVSRNDFSYTDNIGSYTRVTTSIFDVFEEPPNKEDPLEQKTLAGQFLWNNQLIRRKPSNNVYSISDSVFYFPTGAIGVQWPDFNWLPGTGTLIVAIFVYGTGEYLGVSGFMELDIITYERDCEGNSRYTAAGTLVFTN